TLLQRLPLEDVLEVEPAEHLGLAHHRQAPGSRAHLVRITARRFLVGPELVEVVVGGDLIVCVGLLAHRVARIALVRERRAGGLRTRGSAQPTGGGARERRGQERAPAQIDFGRCDLGRRYAGRTLEHGWGSSLGSRPARGVKGHTESSRPLVRPTAAQYHTWQAIPSRAAARRVRQLPLTRTGRSTSLKCSRSPALSP